MRGLMLLLEPKILGSVGCNVGFCLKPMAFEASVVWSVGFLP